MQKKFALLTAQIKSERRNSRRIDYRRSVTSSQDNGLGVFGTSGNNSVTASYPAPHFLNQLHHHHHVGGTAVGTVIGGSAHTGLPLNGSRPVTQPLTASGAQPTTRHSANCRYSQQHRGRQLSSQLSGDQRIPVTASASSAPSSGSGATYQADTEDSSSNSSNPAGPGNAGNHHSAPSTNTAGIQSFPLDETCVYSNSGSFKQSSSTSSSPRVPSQTGRCREGEGSPVSSVTATPAGGSAQLSRLPSQTSQSSTSSSGSVAGRGEGGGSGSRSQRKMSAPPPNVPRRTVSRLSSSEGLSPQTSRDGSATSQPSHNIQTTTCFLAASASSSPSNSTSKKSPSPGYLVSDVVDCRVPPATGHTLSSQAKHSHQPGPSAVAAYNRHQHSSSNSSSGGGGTNVVAPSEQTVVPTVISSSNINHISNHHHNNNNNTVSSNTQSEVVRKRHYRTGLNIFNKKPEKGVAYLIKRGFLENSPQHVARFLITRKGLSKQMIGLYLGNLQYAFNMAVLECFANELDFAGLEVDVALRKFQTHFRMPGEAQKIERLVEVFSERYCHCNPALVSKLRSADTVFILSFAIILLNTDLHTPSLKADKRMKLEDFVKNLRGIDDRHDVDHEMLVGIYERIRTDEFRPGQDHVSQVVKVQKTIEKNCPDLALPHRRLVCYCRLYEVNDPNKKERQGLHQREVFLFNDILVITKILKRKKNTVTYEFRQSHMLAGLSVSTFENQFYPYGIKISPGQKNWENVLNKGRSSASGGSGRGPLLILNARNEHDREKFVEDLRESIAEMDEMERLRIDGELEKQRLSVVSTTSLSSNVSTSKTQSHSNSTSKSTSDESRRSATSRSATCLRDSGVPAETGGGHETSTTTTVVLRKSAINNSLLDLTTDSSGHGSHHDARGHHHDRGHHPGHHAEKMARRGSVGSLDSGMSVSFHNTSAATATGNGNAGGGLNGSVPGAGGQCLTGHCYHHHYHHLHYMPHPHQHQAPAGGLQPPGRTNHQIDLSAPNPSSRSQHHTHNQQATNSHHQQHHKQYR